MITKGSLQCSTVFLFQESVTVYKPFLDQIPIWGYYANSADPVQMLQNAASHQDLHCLLTEISMENAVKMITAIRNP